MEQIEALRNTSITICLIGIVLTVVVLRFRGCHRFIGAMVAICGVISVSTAFASPTGDQERLAMNVIMILSGTIMVIVGCCKITNLLDELFPFKK